MAGTLGEYGSQRCTLIFSGIVCIYAAVIRMSGNQSYGNTVQRLAQNVNTEQQT